MTDDTSEYSTGKGRPAPGQVPVGERSGSGARIRLSSMRSRAARARRSRTWRRVRQGALAGLAVAAVLLAVRPTYPLRVAELKSYDARVKWLGAAPAHPDMVLIAIDDRSLEYVRPRLGRWPWPRDVHANMLEFLTAAGARLVVFDIGFFDPQLDDPAADSTLGAAISAGAVVLPVTFGRRSDAADVALRARTAEPEAERLLQRFAIAAASPIPPVLAYERVVDMPPPVLGRGVRALGSITFHSEPEDGTARRQPLVFGHRGALYPSLPMAAARVLDPERFGGEITVSERELRTAGERVPLYRGQLLVRWRGPYLDGAGDPTYPVISAYEVLNSYEQVLRGLEPDVPWGSLEDRIVFVGATAAGLLDLRSTPLHPQEPGFLIHATLLDNLLRGDYLRRAGTAAHLGLLLVVAVGAAVLVGLVGSAALAALATLALLGLATAVSFAAFASGVWIELAAPLLGGGGSFAAAMALNYVTEGRERKRVRDMFSRYVPAAYVRRLADDYEALRLGGDRVTITILFSDIRGFTALAERLPAETVIERLNEYLERMATVVFRNGGTLDKFIGDAVMAFWGAPVAVEDHARRAVTAALEMLEEVERLNGRWAARGIESRLEIGIGIHTGEAVVGNIGSLSHKLDYTAIGDAVNLASRLESLNKEYGTHALVSDATRAAVGDDRLEWRPLGPVRVKGKEQPVMTYELVGRASPVAGAVQAGLAALAAVALLAVAPAPASAQGAGAARWVDWVYEPGQWRGGELVRYSTANPATDTLAVVAQVDTYARPPRWRAEIRRVEADGALGEPLVLVADAARVVVLTRLGSTPLPEHASAEDALVRAVAGRFADDGRAVEPGRARLVDLDADELVQRIVYRQPVARAEFPDHLLAAGSAGRLGRRLLEASARELGPARPQEVVATAGARGVVRVRTVDGEIDVMPDAAALLALQRRQVGVVDLDRFLREALLGPYGPAAKEETQ